MTDFVLEVRYPRDRRDLDDHVEAVTFLSSCLGSTIDEYEGLTVVSCHFAGPSERDDVMRQLSQLDGIDVRAEQRDDVDWLTLYRQSLEPIEIGQRFIVVADGDLAPESARILLVIPQQQAFGTGSHATTAMCLEMLEEISIGGLRGLDVGTGSGILAIGMIQLGAQSVIAIENDLDTWGVVRSNAEKNEVDPFALRLLFASPEALRGEHFEVVTMNILAEVIVELLPQVHSLLRPGGALIVSGVIDERRASVVDAAARFGLELISERERGEWWAGRFRRPPIEY